MPNLRSCCSCWPGCSTTASTPGRILGRARWRIAPDAQGDGFSTWRPDTSRVVELEDHESSELAESLEARGHVVRVQPGGFGHAHLIDVRPNGALAGAADPRALTGMAAGI